MPARPCTAASACTGSVSWRPLIRRRQAAPGGLQMPTVTCYTPPQQRGHGYGTAATAAVTRHAIETGAPEVLLFTDATNPVTNSIYRRLGYRPAEDRLILTFT